MERDPFEYKSIPPRNVTTVKATIVNHEPHRIVDPFANGQHFDQRMNMGIEDIKREYPWLCSRETVFR